MKNIILQRYIKIALNNFSNVIEQPKHYTFKCNVCGDSEKNKHSMRGHIRFSEKNNMFSFFCYNAGCPAEYGGQAWPAQKWLKFTNNSLHSQYVKELFQPKNEKDKIKKLNETILTNTKRRKRKEQIKNIKILPILHESDEPIFKTAITYCGERKIDKIIWERWFVCVEGKYKNRLVIPFFDSNNKIYYYQARALMEQIPKYLNRSTGKDKAIYNYDFINKKEPIHVFEGLIDSLFVENSIAIIGLNLSDYIKEQLDKLEHVRWMMDNDEAGKKKSEEFLLEKKYVFLWKEFIIKYNLPLDTKDINEAILHLNIKKFTTEELSKFFTNSYYDIIRL
jgi:hypothetical protein